MNKHIYINARFLTQNLTGVQRFAYEISKLLSNAYQNRIIFLIPKKSKIKSCYSFNFNISRIGKFNGHLWEQIDLPSYLIKNKKPLLISLTNSNPIFYKNSISTIHDLSVYKNKNWFTFSYSLFYKFLIQYLIKNSIHILTVSKFCKSEIIETFNIIPSKVTVIYNAVSFQTINKLVNKDLNYILFVGSISERKNLNNLIDAFSLINDPNLKLKVVGEKFKHLNTNNSNSNYNIEYLSNVRNDELIDLYSNAIMLVFPSFYEGFGIPPLEAMHCNCPAIVSDIPVLREIYEDSVLYFNPYNKDEINNTICKVINDNILRKNLIKLGSKQINKYSWKESSNKLIRLINRIEN